MPVRPHGFQLFSCYFEAKQSEIPDYFFRPCTPKVRLN